MWGELASHKRSLTPVLKAGHPGVPSYYMFVCLGYGWVGYFTFLFFLIAMHMYFHVFDLGLTWTFWRHS